MDVWDSQAKGLGVCQGFVIPSTVDDLRVYIKHTSKDAWYGQTIWIVTEVMLKVENRFLCFLKIVPVWLMFSTNIFI